MRMLSFAVAMTMATALHAQPVDDQFRQPKYYFGADWYLESEPTDPFARYVKCERLSLGVSPGEPAEAYVACLRAEAEEAKLQALRKLAWPKQPGRH